MGGKVVVTIGAAVLAVVGVAALAAFFVSRDDATVPRDDAGPGVARVNSDPQVRPGNIVLIFSDERLTSDLRALARRTAGEPNAALEAAGQAVLLERRPNMTVPVTAVTSKRLLEARGADDPKLQSFIEFWLGRAS
jgi:hypothetical protein